MIEVRMNIVDLKRIKHDMLHSVAMIERLKKAGVPIIGILLMRGVERGTLTWHTEEDLDGDISVLRWYDTHEPIAVPQSRWRCKPGEQHDGWSWASYTLDSEDDDL